MTTGRRDLWRWIQSLGVLLVILAAVAHGQTDTIFVPGQTYFGRNQYVEYYAGNLPYVLSAPHGGSVRPTEIPDRTWGETTQDSYVQDVARDFIAATLARMGKHPHVIICRLHRVKLDANRDSAEGAQGNPYALQAWQEYHRFIEAARKAVVASYGRGLYIDLHGHGHTIQRLELGYLLSASQLSLSDDSLNTPRLVASASVRTVATNSPEQLSGVIRGVRSLGTYFENRGFPAVPSTMQPSPGTAPYFTGGYSTERHGSVRGGAVDAIQIESNFTGVRDTDANRKRYAGVIAEVLDFYTQIHHLGAHYATAAVTINEVLFDLPRDDTTTTVVEGDANGDGIRSVRGDEFIEIVNRGNQQAQLSGYRILERDMQTVFTFPEGTTLDAGEYAVVFGGVGPAGFGPSLPARAKLFAAKPGLADSGFYASSSKTNLLTAGDNVVLLHPPTNEVMDEICWGSAQPRTTRGKKMIPPNTLRGDSIAGAIAQAVTRSPDITGLWTTHLSLTSGAAPYSPGSPVVTSVAVAGDVSQPSTFSLEQNYPNPFNPATRIRFTIPTDGYARLNVYNALGQHVQTVWEGHATAGRSYDVAFDAAGLCAAAYLVRLEHNGASITRKILYVK